MAKQVNDPSKVETIYMVHQACLYFKLKERNRAVAEMKYKEANYTLSKWEKIFKEEHLI